MQDTRDGRTVWPVVTAAGRETACVWNASFSLLDYLAQHLALCPASSSGMLQTVASISLLLSTGAAAFVGQAPQGVGCTLAKNVATCRPTPLLRAPTVAVRMGIDIDLGGAGNQDKAKDAAAGAVEQASENEMFLAELCFSPPEKLPGIVEKNLDKLNEDFYTFLDAKIKTSTSEDEKETLALLKDAVTDLMTKILKAAVERGDLSAEDVQAAGLDSSTLIDSASGEDMAVLSYDLLIDKLTADPSPAAIDTAVEADFDRLDMRFLERLNERMQEDSPKKEVLTALNSAIQACMSGRVKRASETLAKILKAGDPNAMKKELMILNAKGALDDSVILLLEANIEQAKKAGAAQAVEVMQMLRDKAVDYKDQSMPEEIRLIRKLLRTDDEEARRKMLVEAFKPRDENLVNPDGSARKKQAVSGKQFVTALRTLIADFGNVDERFLAKVDKIAKESEAVASELFNVQQDMDVKELQDEAFHKRSISVWELESLEEQYERSGLEAPWQGESRGGWDKDGNMIIGGNEIKKQGKDSDEGGSGSSIIW